MTDYVNKITCLGNTKNIGGTTFKGAWTPLNIYVATGTSISAASATIYDITNLPNDGYKYEVIGWLVFAGASTNGQRPEITISGNVDKKRYILENVYGGDYVRNKSIMQGGGTFRIVLDVFDDSTGARRIRVRSGNNSAISDFWLYISHYRRIGTNAIEENSYIDKIAIPSSTLTPNVVVYGNPTITNGVMSNFSNSNFAELLNGRQNNNAEYVIKFTTGTIDTVNAQSIFSIENFIVVEIPSNSLNVHTWRWDSQVNITLFTATANTTYWLKIEVNGQTKTYSYSTDGINYTQAASFTDTSISTTENSFHTRFGNHSANNLLHRKFKGTIDFNGCYINVNGSRFWSGVDYKKTLIVGGNILDGQWVENVQNIYSGNPSENETVTISLSSYLPNDGYNYEIMTTGYIYTGTTSGSSAQLKINSGSTPTDNSSACATRVRTSTSSSREGCGMQIIPVMANDKNISIRFSGKYSGSNATWINLIGYRRIGTNSSSSNANNISNVVLPNSQSVMIGGDIADGDWVDIFGTICSNVSCTNGDTFQYNLKTALLPNDNYSYEVLLAADMSTSNVSGDFSQFKIHSDAINANGSAIITALNTRSASINTRSMTTVFPVSSSGNIYIEVLSTSGRNGTLGLYLRGYRRIGTNR